MDNLSQIPTRLPAQSWFVPDNAATLYCAAKRRNWARTLRLAFVLREPVDPDVMQQALEDMVVRFPSFFAQVKNGLFWNYFVRCSGKPQLEKEYHRPGRPIQTRGTNSPNFRVLYYRNRIALEVFHGITDGGGSIRFLTSLVARYYELLGEQFPAHECVLNAADAPNEEETADPYRLNSRTDVHAKNYHQLDAYHPMEKLVPDAMRVTHGFFRVEDAKRAAGAYGLTITEYLTALLIYTYILTTPAPIRDAVSVSIPLDLRRRFGTQSVRNFAYMSDIAFRPDGRRDVTLEEICTAIRGVVLEKSGADYLTNEISANVRAQNSPLLRPIPYFIKHIFLRNTYYKNQCSFTTFLSNVGEITGPEALLAHIARAEFTLGETPFNPFGCGVVSINGLLTVTFNDCTPDMEKQRCFFRLLASQNISVRIETNF